MKVLFIPISLLLRTEPCLWYVLSKYSLNECTFPNHELAEGVVFLFSDLISRGLCHCPLMGISIETLISVPGSKATQDPKSLLGRFELSPRTFPLKPIPGPCPFLLLDLGSITKGTASVTFL